MKNFKALALILFVAAWTTLGFSQTALTSTTLTSNVTGGATAQTFVVLAAVTNQAAPTAAGGLQTILWIDGEAMAVMTVNSTTLVDTVQRGFLGTKAVTHGNGAIVWYGQPSLFAAYNLTPPNNTGRYRYFTTPSVQGSLTGLGTSTTDTAGGIFCGDLVAARAFVSTGGAVLNGATVGTDLNLVALYDYSGTLVSNSATAGAVTAGASAFQQRAWTTPVFLQAGQYFLCYQTNGTTDNFQTIKAASWVENLTRTQTGTFGTLPSPITVPTTFTADKGPIGYVY